MHAAKAKMPEEFFLCLLPDFHCNGPIEDRYTRHRILRYDKKCEQAMAALGVPEADRAWYAKELNKK